VCGLSAFSAQMSASSQYNHYERNQIAF